MYRYLCDWAYANKDILKIGDIMSSDEVYAIISVKYKSWKSTFKVSDETPNEKDDVLSMLWSGMVQTSLSNLTNAINSLSKLTGDKKYTKNVNGEVVKSGNTTRTPNLSDISVNSAYTDNTTNKNFVEKSETIHATVAYNTLDQKNRGRDTTTRTVPETSSKTDFGENTSTLNRTGSEINSVDLNDKNKVSETISETSPDIIKMGIEYVNKQPVYDFIDRFVHQFFTI